MRSADGDPRFCSIAVTFKNTHARWMSAHCPKCLAEPGQDCASAHPRRYPGLRYPVRPHRERRRLVAR